MRLHRPGSTAAVGVSLAGLVTVLVMGLVTVPGADGATRPASRITATWSASKVVVGRPVTVHGQVTSRRLATRTVGLYLSLASGWRRVAVTRSTSAGRYTLTVPTDFVYARALQLRVPGTARARPVTSASHTVSVVPAGTPAGPATAWARYRPTVEQRLDPCRTATYRVVGATSTALADVRAALARVHQATGIRFRSATTGPATVTVAWRTVAASGGELEAGELSDERVGATRAAHDRQGAVRRVVGADVVVNRDEDDYASAMRQAILMHELGHVVGLGHPTDRDQRMYDGIYPGEPTVWGAGDLTGLGRVGLVEGCVTDN